MRLVAVLALAIWFLPAGALAQADGPTRFEEFAVNPVFAGRPAEPAIRDARSRRFAAAIRSGAAAGPNFADHYTVVSWGCGTGCIQFAVVDARTGSVYHAPGIDAVAVGHGRTANPLRYRRDSRLLVVTAATPDGETERRAFVMGREGLAPASSEDGGERVVSAIRSRYAEVNRRIARPDDDAPIYVDELVVNTSGAAWPGSGTYGVTCRFHYESGGAEPAGSPRSLVKVALRAAAGPRVYVEEFLFDATAEPIFHFGRRSDGDAPAERRVYFVAGRAVRIVDDGAARDRLSAPDLEVASRILERGRMMRAAFEQLAESARP